MENRKPKDFDTKKNYGWNTDDLFTVTGAEIDIFNKAITAMMATPDFQRFLIVQRAGQTMLNFLKESYNSGLIYEVKEGSEIKTETSEAPIEQPGQEVSNG